MYGDTLAKAAHLESLSMADQVLLSQSTTELLIAAGKSKWIKPSSIQDGEETTYVLVFKSAALGKKTGNVNPPKLSCMDG